MVSKQAYFSPKCTHICKERLKGKPMMLDHLQLITSTTSWLIMMIFIPNFIWIIWFQLYHTYISRRNLMLKIWTSYYEQICVQKVVCRFSHINPWVSHIWYTYTCIYFRGESVALSKSTYHLSQACTIEPWWSNSICLNFTIQFSNGFWACPAFSSKLNQFVISKHLKSVRKYESLFKFYSLKTKY